MSSTRIESLIDDVQRAFDQPPYQVETGLDVHDAALLQLRKAFRLLAGVDHLLDTGYYKLAIEASFVAIERSIEFRSAERGAMGPRNLPGSHPSICQKAANLGPLPESVADELADSG